MTNWMKRRKHGNSEEYEKGCTSEGYPSEDCERESIPENCGRESDGLFDKLLFFVSAAALLYSGIGCAVKFCSSQAQHHKIKTTYVSNAARAENANNTARFEKAGVVFDAVGTDYLILPQFSSKAHTEKQHTEKSNYEFCLKEQKFLAYVKENSSMLEELLDLRSEKEAAGFIACENNQFRFFVQENLPAKYAEEIRQGNFAHKHEVVEDIEKTLKSCAVEGADKVPVKELFDAYEKQIAFEKQGRTAFVEVGDEKVDYASMQRWMGELLDIVGAFRAEIVYDSAKPVFALFHKHPCDKKDNLHGPSEKDIKTIRNLGVPHVLFESYTAAAACQELNGKSNDKLDFSNAKNFHFQVYLIGGNGQSRGPYAIK